MSKSKVPDIGLVPKSPKNMSVACSGRKHKLVNFFFIFIKVLTLLTSQQTVRSSSKNLLLLICRSSDGHKSLPTVRVLIDIFLVRRNLEKRVTEHRAGTVSLEVSLG